LLLSLMRSLEWGETKGNLFIFEEKKKKGEEKETTSAVLFEDEKKKKKKKRRRQRGGVGKGGGKDMIFAYLRIEGEGKGMWDSRVKMRMEREKRECNLGTSELTEERRPGSLFPK